jgi:hypothetical protein
VRTNLTNVSELGSTARQRCGSQGVFGIKEQPSKFLLAREYRKSAKEALQVTLAYHIAHEITFLTISQFIDRLRQIFHTTRNRDLPDLSYGIDV